MKPSRIVYRTRGGPTQGWGNVFRLASFAERCRDRGHADATFLAEGPPEVIDDLRSREFEVVPMPDGVELDAEAEALAEHGPADLSFVEMLDVTPERQRLLRRHTGRLVVFDDLCDHVYDADLVVCGQTLPSYANRALSAPGTRFLVGAPYFLCRPEFVHYAGRRREYAGEPRSVLVALGGGRYDAGYLKAALAIASLDPVPRATFVLGPGAQGDLGDRVRAILPGAEVLGGVADLERRMWATDLLVASAGYTKLEAAITQTPCVLISVQWHQIPLAAAFAGETGARDLGYMAYVSPDSIAAALEELRPPEVRRERARRARAAVDGLGFERVYRAAFEPSA